VANFDEDSLTMAVEAVINATKNVDRTKIDGLYYASTTPPFVEKQTAAFAAVAADLGKDEEIFTVDCSDSLRAGTSALKMAVDAIKAGSAKNVVVAAADCRMAAPLSGHEQNLGDGAAALLLGEKNVIASIEGQYSLSTDFTDFWKYPGDKFIRSWQDRFAYLGPEGFQPTGKKAIGNAMKKFGVEPKDIAKVVFTGPEARGHGILGKGLGFSPEQVQDPLFEVMGNTGAAFPLMLLIDALDNANPGDLILLAGFGDGMDVFLLKATPALVKARKDLRGVRRYLKSKRYIQSYLKYLRLRHLFPVQKSRMSDVIPGLAQNWRERDSLTKLHGSKCKKCGTVEYPIRRICPKCHSKDEFDQVRLADMKTLLYAFSTDTNPAVPDMTESTVVRCVVEFDGGARIEGESEACLEELEVGLPMEMVFRKFERQGDVPAYA
ncbi:MAG: 3-oxoacyl-[acyl-carrier-protein] synthase III C-terminal domain-containing protein, partial [bacterium]